MKKEAMQNLWNSLLIAGWKKDNLMRNVMHAFLKKIKPDLLNDKGEYKDIEKTCLYINSLKIRRCLDRDNDDRLAFRAWKQPTRVFVAMRSPNLGDCLWNKDNTEEAILAAIDCFKWTRRGPKAKKRYQNKRQKNINRVKSEVVIKARSLTSTGRETAK